MLSGERQIAFMRARFIVALVALFSLTVQSYLIQTHIHVVPGIHAAPESQIGAQAPGGHKAPANKDSSDNCPICQAFALAGTFLSPAVAGVAASLIFVELLPALAVARVDLALFRLSRQSRAPPRV